MQYAFVNNIRSLPEKGKTGTCILCKNEVIAKCGNINVHHWAHKRSKDCDTWSEPETEWHREWKNRFPESYREIGFEDPKTNEKHRADIHTNEGVTIEFQNSPISVEEFNSRTNFYKKLIWVVNAINFKDNFIRKGSIANPTNPLLKGFEIRDGVFYYMKEEIEELGIPRHRLYRVYSLRDPELKGVELSNIHYAFTWQNKRKVWFEASTSTSVFLDFGGEDLYWLRKREQVLEPFWYIQIVKKSAFIKKYTDNKSLS